jgi:hypothetical protein
MNAKGSTGIRIWLDDNRPAPEGWVHARNIEQVQVRLLHNRVEELSLDFDLDNPACPACDFKCGYRDDTGCKNNCACHSNGAKNGLDLVKWMVSWRIWPKHKPVVHSMNGEGAEKMKMLIEQNYPG